MARCGLRGPARRARGPAGVWVCGRCAVRGAPRAPCAALARAHARGPAPPAQVRSARTRSPRGAGAPRTQSYQSRLSHHADRSWDRSSRRPRSAPPRCTAGAYHGLSRACAPVFISFAYLPYLSTCNSCVRSASIRIVNVSMIRTPRPARRQHIRVRFGLCDAPRATQPAGATATVPLLSSPRHKPHSLRRSCFVREPLSQFACTSTGERRWAARHVALEYR